MTIKKAFTLFELLIVVSLIGIVYSVFTQKLNIKQNPTILTLQNFIPWVANKSFRDLASIVCLFDEKDSGCRLYLDNVLQDGTKFVFFKKFDDVIAYKVGYSDFEEIQFPPFVEEEIKKDVFFRFDIFPNGGFSTMVLKKNDTFFFYNSYHESLMFDSLGDINDYLWDKKKVLQEKL